MYLLEKWVHILALSTTFHLVLGEDSGYISSRGYAPTVSPCPRNFQVRQTGPIVSKSQSLGAEEANYITSRRSKVIPKAYKTYLTNLETYVSGLGKPAVKLPPYVSKILASGNQTTLPRMSVAVAGGAYRGKQTLILF